MENTADAERIEQLIICEITRLQSQNKRADFASMAHSVESSHGLGIILANSYLKQLTTSRKIKVILRGRAESITSIEKGVNFENKNDKTDRETKRRASNDEGKVWSRSSHN